MAYTQKGLASAILKATSASAAGALAKSLKGLGKLELGKTSPKARVAPRRKITPAMRRKKLQTMYPGGIPKGRVNAPRKRPGSSPNLKYGTPGKRLLKKKR